jgi:hypothetical protein
MSRQPYPLATTKGLSIPLDAVYPELSFVVADNTVVDKGIAIGQLLRVWSEAPMRVYVGALSSADMAAASLANSIYIPANKPTVLYAQGSYVGAKAQDTSAKPLYVTLIATWEGMVATRFMDNG